MSIFPAEFSRFFHLGASTLLPLCLHNITTRTRLLRLLPPPFLSSQSFHSSPLPSDNMHLLPSLALPALMVASAKTTMAFAPSLSSTVTTHHHAPSLSAPFTTILRARKSQNDGDERTSNISDKQAVNPAKKAALDGVLQRIERNYGRGSIVKLGDADRMVVECIGSGSLTLGELLFFV